ncbi:hypothetical protein GPECTOR_80g154 [Gonium pectorale]|uniref:PAS domain-containing protein n=1 Tax=Gonium pectorale TaxID=33097 RepID=A0A150G1U9_GONPE|nr:hypothetical protein GPECTOR_80g154 [Gonium pectorale]|eukprot:KXZ43794.1 hypothetical protein GPECTOR_80g154 [Gonium pectorale]
MLEARDSNPRGPGGSSSTCGPVLRLSTSSGATSLRCVLANAAALRALGLADEEAVLDFLASRFSADRGLVGLFQDTVNRLLSGQLSPAHHFIPGDFGADRYFLSMKISPFKLRTARPGAGAAAQGGPPGSRVLPALLLELDVPYEGRDLAARLQRDYLIMSNIPSPVTIFDMAGHVLHQNRASVAYLGYRVGQGLRAREEARRAARDGVGAAGGGTTAAGAPEAAPMLAELFCLDPDKLTAMLAALEQGKEWRGLVQMAPSLVPQLERGEGWDYGPEGGEAEAPPQDCTSLPASDGASQPLLHPGRTPTPGPGPGNRGDARANARSSISLAGGVGQRAASPAASGDLGLRASLVSAVAGGGGAAPDAMAGATAPSVIRRRPPARCQSSLLLAALQTALAAAEEHSASAALNPRRRSLSAPLDGHGSGPPAAAAVAAARPPAGRVQLPLTVAVAALEALQPKPPRAAAAPCDGSDGPVLLLEDPDAQGRPNGTPARAAAGLAPVGDARGRGRDAGTSLLLVSPHDTADTDTGAFTRVGVSTSVATSGQQVGRSASC